ncbi:hypothetical protein I553_8461 [Mycobacterium xenopi 4042]|uniref:Uncharacterized protein n=1 Tax=Mycobacterium xenopi 4042 TaxID=1299334 RepID=X8CLT2_MYCXE|nr:hypothetical protein I552_8121 [Mycobacterium xenopi 3993]EUA56413.1 hypothetical protein I553_8461 [Mycobacterium xenopi 4042]
MAAIVSLRDRLTAAPRNCSTNFIAPTHPNFHLPLDAAEWLFFGSQTQRDTVWRLSPPWWDVAVG